jgi:hypothetical protein
MHRKAIIAKSHSIRSYNTRPHKCGREEWRYKQAENYTFEELHLCTFKPPIYISPSRLCRDAEYNKGVFISCKVTVAKAQLKTPNPSGRRLECAMV